MEAFAFRLTQLQEQMQALHGLVTTVSRLSAENRALKDELADVTSTVGHLATDNARLSSKVAELETLVTGQEELIGELETSSYPEGRFVFAPAKGGKPGVWWWSQTRFPSSVPLAGPTAAGQLATLADLPFELLSEILSLVEPETIFKLVLVSYRLFTLLTPVIYPEGLKLTAEQARKYLYPRILCPASWDGRVRTFPRPRHLQLHSLASRSRDAPFALPGRGYDQYCLRITLYIESNAWNELLRWRNLLRAFDPDELVVVTPDPRPNLRVPTPLKIEAPRQECRLGLRLTSIRFEGPESIPIGNANFVRSRTFPKDAYALLVSPNSFDQPRQGRQPPLFRLKMHRAVGRSSSYRAAREEEIAGWLLDPAFMRDDRVVAVELRQE